jgi:hypothetical protein
MKMKKIFLLLPAAAFLMTAGCTAKKPDATIGKVHVIFKTHLDIGFTDLPSKVEHTYVTEFIPKAIEVAGQLRAEGAEERYVWTTGAWLIDSYLGQASPEAVGKLEEAIRRGDIVWNGTPYTFESEAANREVFATTLKLAKRLDTKYGKQTVAAKMTDVPGHTRSIITPLCDAGIRFLHIGVNGASAVPEVPPVCLWRNSDGREIILAYQGSYGSDMILPDGRTAMSINFTSDNVGPHSVEEVKNIFAELRQRYPDAEIVASSLNDVAKDLLEMKEQLPVLTSEIGDTWIYGYASAPVMMARARALERLFAKWLENGRLDGDSDTAIDFAVTLGLVAEHTWGLDVKTFIKNWDRYDVEPFNAGRDLPEIKLGELSWQEKADRVAQAIALLPDDLQAEAFDALKNIGTARPLTIAGTSAPEQLDKSGGFKFAFNGAECMTGQIAYQTYSADDYIAYRKAYIRGTHEWALGDFGKPGLENSKAQNATVTAVVDRVSTEKSDGSEIIDCIYAFPNDARIDPAVLPRQIHTRYTVADDGRRVDMTLSLVDKPAVRLPEAYWVSFVPSGVKSVIVEKMGQPVDVLDVVPGGNRQMHAIDNYVDLVTDKGTIRIISRDAPVVTIGERRALNFSTRQPDIGQGVHFCLFNNLWGTNFAMWWGGSMEYHFTILFGMSSNN